MCLLYYGTYCISRTYPVKTACYSPGDSSVLYFTRKIKKFRNLRSTIDPTSHTKQLIAYPLLLLEISKCKICFNINLKEKSGRPTCYILNGVLGDDVHTMIDSYKLNENVPDYGLKLGML